MTRPDPPTAPRGAEEALQSSSAPRHASAAFAAAIAAVAADQLTKSQAFAYVARNGDLELNSFLSITAGTNSGVAFGLGTALHPLLLVGIAGAISVWILVLVRTSHGLLRQTALGALLGGALGNIIDRARLGAVRDFINLHWEGWHWPTFNLADVFILTGVLLLVFVPDTAQSRHDDGRSRAHAPGKET